MWSTHQGDRIAAVVALTARKRQQFATQSWGTQRMSKYTTIDDRLYAYLLAHQPPKHRQLRALRARTNVLPDARMQITPEQGHFLSCSCVWLLLGRRSKSHLHRVQRPGHGAGAATGRSAHGMRGERGIYVHCPPILEAGWRRQQDRAAPRIGNRQLGTLAEGGRKAKVRLALRSTPTRPVMTPTTKPHSG